ncbi:MAG: acyltransferase [Holosporaceae bacterium]|jgi:peptidoglycan/LPS O-acetylase OafA/YrhL|nr:acyltransferase [Holosporaceae bacterium]
MIEGIERLRGYACILTLVQHILWICPLRFFCGLISPYFGDAGGGMRIFFAISGFVVTLSLKDKIAELKGSEFQDRLFAAKDVLLSFYKKRFFRIFPMVLFICLLVGIFLSIREHNLDWVAPLLRSPAEIFFGVYNNSMELFEHTNPIYNAGLGPFWTLGIEAQFYILWPLVLILCPNNNVRIILALVLGTVFLFIIQPLFVAYCDLRYYLFHNNVAEIFLGSFLAYLYSEKTRLNISVKWARFVVVIFALLVWFYPNSLNRSFFSWLVVSASAVSLVFLAAFVPGSCRIPLLDRFLAYLGSRSFSIYAVHLVLANVVVWFTESAYFPKDSFYEQDLLRYQFWIFLVLLFVMAELAHRFVEKPFRQMGRK